MKPWYSAFVVLVLGCACIAQAGESRHLEQAIKLEAGQLIRIEISVAELRIEARDRSDVGIDLMVECRWHFSDCDEALEELEIATRSSSRRLTLELSGLRRWESSLMRVEGTVEVPRTSALEVKMGVADLEIEGVEKDLRVDLGVGKLDLRLSKARFGEAFVDVGVGKVRFYGGGELEGDRRSFLVGNEVHWTEGAGKAELDIEVGVGEVKVRLE